jgi:hypothetical protein
MRYVYAVAFAIILGNAAIKLHQCKCGSHKRRRRMVGQPAFFPTTYGGFYSQTREVSCEGCGRQISLGVVTWNRLSPEMVALFI